MQSVCPDNSNPADTENVKKRPNKNFPRMVKFSDKIGLGEGFTRPKFQPG